MSRLYKATGGKPPGEQPVQGKRRNEMDGAKKWTPQRTTQQFSVRLHK
jgi:hypothetical protein